MTQFTHLFTPLKIKNVTIRNRLLSTGHVPGYAKGGYPVEQYRLYHVEKAKGGIGLTIFGGSTSVAWDSPATEWSMIANRDDSIIPYYQQLADAVHEHGAKIFTQLTHMGRRNRSDSERWLPLVGPSQIREPYHREIPHEIEKKDIRRIVQAFGQAVRRAKEGRLDGVELSYAHNHLADQFWSPKSNHRTDEYGGSLENRMRFSLEVLEEIRKVVGDDYIVGVRMSGDEFLDGGLTVDDQIEIATRLAATGMVDFVNVLGGCGENVVNLAAVVPNMYFPPAPYIALASAIKAEIDIPVFHAARIVDPVQAERILAEGHVDMVGMTRAHIADPYIGKKALEGRLDDIRQCVGANMCIDRLYSGKQAFCIQNPVTGREAELGEVKPAERSRRVVVVGGGPGGLEAARMAAERGHKVVLFEKSDRLGGQVNLAAIPPGRDQMAGITRWLEMQCRKLGVDIRLGVAASAETVLAEQPEAVVIATGGRPNMGETQPEIDLSGGNGNVVSVQEVLEGRAAPGQNVVVFDDIGDWAGVTAAEYLAQHGAHVTLVTPDPRIAVELGDASFPVVYQRLYSAGINLIRDHKLVAVEEDGDVVLRNVYSFEEPVIPHVDQVVVWFGNLSEDSLYRQLQGRVDNLHLVGDAVAPRGIHNAMLEGTRVARQI